MDGVAPENQGTVRYALDLLNTVNGSNSLGFTPFKLSDFTFYEFELMNYLQTQLAATRPKNRGYHG